MRKELRLRLLMVLALVGVTVVLTLWTVLRSRDWEGFALNGQPSCWVRY